MLKRGVIVTFVSLMNGGLILANLNVNYHLGCRYCLEAFSMDGEFSIGAFVSICPFSAFALANCSHLLHSYFVPDLSVIAIIPN